MRDREIVVGTTNKDIPNLFLRNEYIRFNNKIIPKQTLSIQTTLRRQRIDQLRKRIESKQNIGFNNTRFENDDQRLTVKSQLTKAVNYNKFINSKLANVSMESRILAKYNATEYIITKMMRDIASNKSTSFTKDVVTDLNNWLNMPSGRAKHELARDILTELGKISNAPSDIIRVKSALSHYVKTNINGGENDITKDKLDKIDKLMRDIFRGQTAARQANVAALSALINNSNNAQEIKNEINNSLAVLFSTLSPEQQTELRNRGVIDDNNYPIGTDPTILLADDSLADIVLTSILDENRDVQRKPQSSDVIHPPENINEWLESHFSQRGDKPVQVLLQPIIEDDKESSNDTTQAEVVWTDELLEKDEVDTNKPIEGDEGPSIVAEANEVVVRTPDQLWDAVSKNTFKKTALEPTINYNTRIKRLYDESKGISMWFIAHMERPRELYQVKNIGPYPKDRNNKTKMLVEFHKGPDKKSPIRKGVDSIVFPNYRYILYQIDYIETDDNTIFVDTDEATSIEFADKFIISD